MPTTLEERVAYLEGKVEEHSHTWQDLREQLREINQRITHLEGRINAFEETIDRRFEAIDRHFEAIERRFEAIEGRINTLDQKFSRYFLWIIVIQITIFLALLTTLLK